MPGVCFEQDGILFTSAGVEALPDDYAAFAEELLPPDNPYDPMIGVVVIQGGEEPVHATQRVSGHDSFETMHHMQLKALCKLYEIPYVDKDSAIAQLRGTKKSA